MMREVEDVFLCVSQRQEVNTKHTDILLMLREKNKVS